MIAAALTGFFTAFSLILAIGAQNAFVLRQGILRQHVFPLCMLCALSDAVLITAGVLGFGWIVRFDARLPAIMAAAGAIFLLVYGALRFHAAFKASGMRIDLEGGTSLGRTLAVGLALTWLNPHVYLDTLGLIGAVSTQYPEGPARLVFALGAMTSSFVFFFSLGYGARLLRPVMQLPRAWQIFDVLIGATMWIIAAGLIAAYF